jgi:predicted O-linked N-acetylglucosamine transferase (SPINDLY family)
MAQPTIQQTFDQALQHHQAGRLHEAEQLYRLILAQRPEHVDAMQNLGIIAQEAGRKDVAVDLIGRAVALSPNNAEAHSNLGNALKENGQLDEAIAACRRAIALRPNLPEAHANLGAALAGKGQFDEAIVACGRAIALRPNLPEAYTNLGVALAGKGQLDEAIAAFRRAIALRPNFPEAHGNLGNALRDKGQLDEAIAAYHHVISLRPNYAEAHNNLGIALTDQGRLDEAIGSYRRALQLKSDYVEAHSNLLLAMLYRSGEDEASILAEHRAWSAAHARPLENKIKNHGNDRSGERRLRVGYVSADFRHHPVGYFLLPLLERHDRANFEIYCYFNSRRPDSVTERFKHGCNVWRDVANLSDEDVASRVRSDAIDILVDLSAHTHGSRLLVFARKPAPIQVTYLAYPGTTGLQTIDYRFTDPYLDPPDQLQECYTEKSVRLPRSYWCYQPSIVGPEISPLPAAGAGFITFGCLNNFAKVTPAVVKTWSEILLAVPDSRLALHAIAGSHRDRIRNAFAEFGVAAARINFVGWLPAAEYMGQYRQIDVALDPFPYAGGTTTCNALWMGVPVVTLAGRTAIGRGGVSILTNVGLTDLIARSLDDYVHLAVALANDKARLGQIRSTIREQMKLSPLMDANQFAADVENAYRQMWRAWCFGSPSPAR